MANNLTYQTNFTGVKYNNNPLALDPHSFSNANNVYPNKYGVLISRSPIMAQDYPYQAYSATTPKPIELKLIGTYNLVNNGIIYIVLNTTTGIHTLRYKSPSNVYSSVNIVTSTVTSLTQIAVTQYKQYFIVFTKDESRALNTLTNTWTSLSSIVEVPVTSIRTGNEQLTLPSNQFTNAYKTQFILKPDNDDTIYALPINKTATITFPNQTDLTYDLTKSEEYTRIRLLRKLNTPPNSNLTGLISMVGDKIAIAHADRFDLSLDGGETFSTIVYPTTAGDKYKNTASLSDDGQCFFYVHEDGVYRYMLGTEEWLLIEVQLTQPLVNTAYPSYTLERPNVGKIINSQVIGANYCHFVNPEKFAFMLAYTDGFNWTAIVYTKGLNMTNLVDGTTTGHQLTSGANYLNSYTTSYTIGSNTTIWAANPYLNKNLVKVMDNNTVAFYNKHSASENRGLLLRAAPAHIYLFNGYDNFSIVISSFAINTHTWTPAGANEMNMVVPLTATTLKILVKRTTHATVWYQATITYSATLVAPGGGIDPTFTIAFTASITTLATLTGITGSSSIVHEISPNRYLSGTTLHIVSNNTVTDTYTLPLSLTVSDKVVFSGSNYLIFNGTDKWYTNIPLVTTLTYTTAETTLFTQVPTATFDDQNLWLGMSNTLWIANMINDKLSALSLSNNTFSKVITAIIPISPTSKAIFFVDGITLCEEVPLNDGSIVWQYHPLKFSVGVRQGDSVITTNDGKLTIFPTKYGLAVLTYQLDVATTEQAITYLTDDIHTLWTDFYTASTSIKILHHNTQLLLSNGTNQLLIYDFRTNGWYPQTLPTNLKVSKIQPMLNNYEHLQLQPLNAPVTTLTEVYQLNKDQDELYSYAKPYKDLSTIIIPWNITSQILLLNAPNHYKNISQLIIDQIDSNELRQSAYLTTQVFRQLSNTVKPAIELIYNIDTFSKIVKKVNWWKVLGFKWQLENDAKSSYPTQLRLYNLSIKYDVSYEVK
jgi:hypothetical protein